MHVLGSCKRFKMNQLIPSKPYFLNFFKYVTWVSAMLKRIKYNIIHELSPQGHWTWLNWARKKCVTKIGINISPPSMHGACSMHVSNWYFPLLVDVVGLGISIPKHSLFSFCFFLLLLLLLLLFKRYWSMKPICRDVMVTSPRNSSCNQVISPTQYAPWFLFPHVALEFSFLH